MTFCLYAKNYKKRLNGSKDVVVRRCCHFHEWLTCYDILSLCKELQKTVERLKGNSGEKIVTHFLLESHRPSKMMNICKKSLNFLFWTSVTSSLSTFTTRIPFIYWKLEKGKPHNFLNNWVGSIKFYISNIFLHENPKIVFIFEIDDAFLNHECE